MISIIILHWICSQPTSSRRLWVPSFCSTCQPSSSSVTVDATERGLSEDADMKLSASNPRILGNTPYNFHGYDTWCQAMFGNP